MKNTKTTLKVSSQTLFTYNKKSSTGQEMKTVVPTLPTVIPTFLKGKFGE